MPRSPTKPIISFIQQSRTLQFIVNKVRPSLWVLHHPEQFSILCHSSGQRLLCVR
uniref:Uncharacterized protein n=1 Tax=Parascaris univalens TaxID=6257 RepID=A0A915A0F9_PARUN